MGKSIMGAVVSLDGFIAEDNDDPGPLFDWYGNGDVAWSFPGADRPFFATGALAEPLRLENPAEIVTGDRVTDLVYDVGH